MGAWGPCFSRMPMGRMQVAADRSIAFGQSLAVQLVPARRQVLGDGRGRRHGEGDDRERGLHGVPVMSPWLPPRSADAFFHSPLVLAL